MPTAAEHMKENLFTIGASDGTPGRGRSKTKSKSRPQAAGHPRSPHGTEKDLFLASLSEEQRAMWEALQQQQQQHAAIDPPVAPSAAPSTPPTVLRPTSLEPPPPPQPPSPSLAPSVAPPPASQHNPSSPPGVPTPGPLPDASEVKFELGASSPQRGSKLRGGGGGTRGASFPRGGAKRSPQGSKGGDSAAGAAPLTSPIVPPASPAPPPKVAWAEPASPAAAADAGPSVRFSIGEEPRSRSKASGKRAARRESFGMKVSPKPNQKHSSSAAIGTPSGAGTSGGEAVSSSGGTWHSAEEGHFADGSPMDVAQQEELDSEQARLEGEELEARRSAARQREAAERAERLAQQQQQQQQPQQQQQQQQQ